MDRAALVGGLVKAEIVGEDFVVLGAVAEGMALARGTPGVDIEQLGRAVAHLLGGAALGLFPLAGAQAVQGRFVGADAGVTADQVQLAHRHVEHGLVGIFQVQELLQRRRAVRVLLAQVHVDQAPVAADAVGVVHHRVAHVQFGQVLDQRLDVADLFLALAPTRDRAGGEQLGLGDEIDARFQPQKARGQRRRRHAQLFVAGLELGQAGKAGR